MEEARVPQAIVDPDDLHRFAVELKRFTSDVQVQVAGIHRQFTTPTGRKMMWIATYWLGSKRPA